MGGAGCTFALELNQRLGLAVQTEPRVDTELTPRTCPALSTSSSPPQTPDPELRSGRLPQPGLGEGSQSQEAGAGGWHAGRRGSRARAPGHVRAGAHAGLCSAPLKRSDAERWWPGAAPPPERPRCHRPASRGVETQPSSPVGRREHRHRAGPSPPQPPKGDSTELTSFSCHRPLHQAPHSPASPPNLAHKGQLN